VVIRLAELEPKFLKRLDDHHFRDVKGIEEADGVRFLCPKCMIANGMKREGVHSIICWDPGVPQTTRPTPGRWAMLGTGLADLTLKSNSSSILLNGGCAAHFFIEAGTIRNA